MLFSLSPMPAQKTSETIADLEAKLAAAKQAEITRHPRGRPKGSKNKSKEDHDAPSKHIKCSVKVNLKAMPVRTPAYIPAVSTVLPDRSTELTVPDPIPRASVVLTS